MAATSAGKVPTSSADADDPSSRRLLTVLLRRYGIPIAETVTADCADSAVEAAWWLRFPVTLVADGTRLADHAGITRCGLATPGQVRAAYWQLASALGPAMSGVRIRRQPQQGAEVIVRVARDGSGTTQVTLLLSGPAAVLVGARVSRNAPLTARDAAEMLDELHGRSAHANPATGAGAAGGATAGGGAAGGGAAGETAAGAGAAGQAVAGETDEPASAGTLDLAALARLLERVSRLAVGVPHVTELELNPVIVTRGGAAVAGVRGQFRRFSATKTQRAKLRSVS